MNTAAPSISEAEIADIRRIAFGGRNEVIAAIKAALKRRSQTPWSVTGGRGTAYGWLKIDIAPRLATWGHKLKDGATSHNPEDYEECDLGKPGCSMSPMHRAELAALLGLDRVHHQGESIPDSTEYYRVALCRARFGHAGPFTASQYWD